MSFAIGKKIHYIVVMKYGQLMPSFFFTGLPHQSCHKFHKKIPVCITSTYVAYYGHAGELCCHTACSQVQTEKTLSCPYLTKDSEGLLALFSCSINILPVVNAMVMM